MKKPAIAIIANEQTPYRLHLHRRIAAELPQVELWSLFTHELASSPWPHQDCPEIRPVLFGRGDSVTTQGQLSSFPRDWRKGGEILRWLASHNIRLVILFGYNDAARLRILSACHRRGIPCYLFGDSNIRGDHASGLRLAVKKAYLGWVLRHVSGVLHCGRLGREYFLRYGATPDSLFPFPYEPDYELFAGPDPALVASMAANLRLSSARKRFLFVGRLIPAKCPGLLLQTFLQIASRCPDWDLVFAGDGPLRQSLEAAAAALPGRVLFTGFLNSPAQLAALYANCHVFVLPSSYEPWGVVVTEAAAAGLLIIASESVGAAADLIVTPTHGLLFGERCGLSLSDALLAAVVGIGDSPTPIRASLARWHHSNNPLTTLSSLLNQHAITSSHRVTAPAWYPGLFVPESESAPNVPDCHTH